MSDYVLYAMLAVGVVVLLLQLVVLQRSGRKEDALDPYFRAMESGLERVERELREEMGRGRLEAAAAARGDREEQAQSLDRLAKTLSGQLGQLGTLQGQQLESFSQQLSRLTQSNEQRFEQLRLSVEASMPFRTTTPTNSKRCARPSTRSCTPRWNNASAIRSNWSANAWNWCTRGWARCRRWRPGSAISRRC